MKVNTAVIFVCFVILAITIFLLYQDNKIGGAKTVNDVNKEIALSGIALNQLNTNLQTLLFEKLNNIILGNIANIPNEYQSSTELKKYKAISDLRDDIVYFIHNDNLLYKILSDRRSDFADYKLVAHLSTHLYAEISQDPYVSSIYTRSSASYVDLKRLDEDIARYLKEIPRLIKTIEDLYSNIKKYKDKIEYSTMYLSLYKNILLCLECIDNSFKLVKKMFISS